MLELVTRQKTPLSAGKKQRPNECSILKVTSVQPPLMDSATYRHLQGQHSKSCPIPHHNFPSHNLISLETLLQVSRDLNGDAVEDSEKFLESFPCYEPFPYAVEKSCILFGGSRDTDDAAELVKKKIHWERKLKDLRISNVELAISRVKKMKHDKVIKLPKSLKKYIDHFQNDPEPMFSGNYNWLYSGGCLSYYRDCDGIILITGDYSNNQPGFNILRLNETLTEVKHKSFTRLKTYSPVLQTTCKDAQENVIICVRQKNQLNVFKTSKSEYPLPVKLWRKKVLASKLLICAGIKTGSEEIIVTDSSHDAHIFHVETKAKICGHYGKKIAPDSNRNSWSQVAFGHLGIYWAFKNCFAVLDERVMDSGPQLEYNPTTATDNCEEISSFVQSQSDPNYLYLSTTHSVLQMDLRMGKPIQRWTHLLKNPPQFLGNIKDGERNEILLLQSHVVDEVMGIVNECLVNAEGVRFLSKSLPCLLKSVRESLKLAHFHGICLSPFVAKKVDFAITGMQCLKNSQNDIILLTENSGGDIFVSKIKRKRSEDFLTDEDKQEILNSMKTYESHCESVSPRNSVNRRFESVDMSPFLEELKQPAAKVRKRENLENCWKYHEMYSPESLMYYKDVLAQKILKVWGHCSDPLDTGEELMSVDYKVREWMNKC